MSKEKFKTYGNVFDEFTKNNLFKLSSQGYFETLDSAIAMGKEANIFSATTKDGPDVIVKIYRLENCDFNKMYDYIKYDPRFNRISRKRREIIFSWTQREFRNLMKAREAMVRVPMPIHVKHNILILEQVGKNAPAPQLKNAIPNDPLKFMLEVVKNVKKLTQVGLVHADLSEFNILNDNEKPVFIDFSQGTEKKCQLFEELLERDIKNLARFSKKIGVDLTEEKIKALIFPKTKKQTNST